MEFTVEQMAASFITHQYAGDAFDAAEAVGDPYEDGDDVGVVVFEHAEFRANVEMGLAEGEGVSAVFQAINDLRDMEFEVGDHIWHNIRICLQHPEEHPDVHLLVTQPIDAPVLVLKCVEVHEARRHQRLLPTCLMALSRNGQRPILMRNTNLPERMAEIVAQVGIPVQGVPNMVRMA